MTDANAELDVKVDMLIRRPPETVYEAFSVPENIRRFWLASSSGPLETGAVVHWQFKIAGAETDVTVTEARPGTLLDLLWDDGQPLRITFTPYEGDTIVGVEVTGFSHAPTAIESMSGFTLVLSSLKLWLEHGIEGELMYDKFPGMRYADR
ncbi:polyketide cyclase [Kocuria coralli]|uniref:Polyketide cyclase n=1 Tax=Kocuria coralli TaxID=1461025 RepID=A0A5J5KTY5_9MICC|nr:SRPBCC domain-containing protein [Kocuria coralli]KAA9393247.1 polyketide cyclase [Kocuria coralli]